jgi:antitoxin component HigA of HigAB toxin-antitoxin module
MRQSHSIVTIAMKNRPAYTSLQDWLERTGTPVQTLAKLAGMDRTHLSRVLSHSRRCSLDAALRLHRVTGVPVEKLVEWKASEPGAISEQPFNSGTR